MVCTVRLSNCSRFDAFGKCFIQAEEETKMLIRHMEKKNGKPAYRVVFEAVDDGMSSVVDEKAMTINSSSKAYRRTIHNRDENVLKNRFLEGQCPVAKKQGYGQVSVLFFPQEGNNIESIDGFEKVGNQGQRSWFYHKANDKINIGGASLELHSLVSAVDLFDKAKSHDIVCVASVCKDKDGLAEGFTIYFIELLNITPSDELPTDGSATQGEQGKEEQPKAQTDTSGSDAAAQQQQTAEAPKEQSSGSSEETKPNEKFVRRDRNGNMIPFRILNVRNEADGTVDTTGNGGGNTGNPTDASQSDNQTQTQNQTQAVPTDNTQPTEDDAEAVDFPSVFKSFIAGKFAEGFQNLTDKTHYPQLVGAASAVRFDKFPWLGRCTFAAGTNTTIDGAPCLNLSVLPWSHESQSSMEEAWSISRKTASATEIGDDLAKGMTKNAQKNGQQKTQSPQNTQASTAQGTTGNQLLDAASANGQNVMSSTQGTQSQPANQIQAQQSMGHSPTTEDPAQARQALQAVQQTDNKSYLKNLVSTISQKFGNSAGKDEFSHYEIFAKWRDAMFETDPKKSREMGFAPVSSKGELMTKYANLRTSKKSSQWILF